MTSPKTSVPFYLHDLGASDASHIAEVLKTPFLTSGEVGRKVEEQLCAYFSVKHAALTNSCTNGIIATLLALGIGPGDEVIIPAMTFIATANAVELLGARPVFVDVEADTLLVSPQAVAEAITDATRAAIPVHLYGQMADVQGIAQLCRDSKNKIWVLEDAAHCFEGKRDGHRPGTYSDAAAFSFYATKNVTCGEGGAVITNHDDLFETLLATRSQGMSKGAIDRFRNGHYQEWDMQILGMKAQMPDLLAALLPDQIRKVDTILPRRHEVADKYRSAFEGSPLRLVEQIEQCESGEHLFTVGVPPEIRNEAIDALNRSGVGCTVNYKAVTDLAYYTQKYQFKPGDFPVAHLWGQQTISLPLYPSLPPHLQDHVIDVVKNDIYPLVEAERRSA